MVTGNALTPGGTFGIVSPASPYNKISDIERGVAWWEARGYQVKMAAGALKQTNYVAGPPEGERPSALASSLQTEFYNSHHSIPKGT